MPSHDRRTQLSFVCSVLAISALAVVTTYAVSGAGFTTVNEGVDGVGHCENGNPQVNCNLYDGKRYVWLNGGPAANGLGPDGQYFFAVLEPGGQPNPNDGGSKNLSDNVDAYTNRTFTVTGGEVSAYAGTHDYSAPFIRLFDYADTTNPGGVYIMAICSLAKGYPVNPRDCKYDAFKVREGAASVQAHLSGMKYRDTNVNGQFDSGEGGLPGWQITISCSDGTNGTAVTNADGLWSFSTPLHAPAPGTTTCDVKEFQQPELGWSQTGNTVDQSVPSLAGTVELIDTPEEKFYRVTIPNDAVYTVHGLHFGNFNQGEGN